MSTPQRRREEHETEKDIQFLVEFNWQLPSDELRQELNAIIAAADGLERKEFKRRLQLFSDRVIAARASI
jgi:hypothetical protein